MATPRRGTVRFRKGARFFENDLNPSQFSELAQVLDQGRYDSEVFTTFALKTLDNLRCTARAIQTRYPPRFALRDPTLYTGGAGICIFFYHVWRNLKRISQEPSMDESLRQAMQELAESALASAAEYASFSLQGLSQSHQRGTFRWDQVVAERGPSVFCGQAGVYLASVLVENARANTEACKAYMEQFLCMGQYAVPDTQHQAPSCADEVLYGSAGYLLGWLYLQRELGPNAQWLGQDIAEDVVEYLMMRGSILADNCQPGANILLYQWHDNMYMGFAHGLMGVTAALLEACAALPEKARPTQSDALLKNTLGFIFSHREPDGFYDTRVKLQERSRFQELRSTDSKRLVQWCHGSPGALFLCAATQRRYPHFPNLSEEASLAARVTWQEGLLRKGPGLCHGIGGNAYALLCCYQIARSSDPNAIEYLQRALAFADFQVSRSKAVPDAGMASAIDRVPWLLYVEGTRIPDNPYSLYEGIAGFGCLLVDLLLPREARMPPC